MNDKLLIGIAFQLWRAIQPLRPRLVYDSASGTRDGFVEHTNAVEVYLVVEGVLEGRCYVVGVVVNVIVASVRVRVLVVAVMRHCDRCSEGSVIR